MKKNRWIYLGILLTLMSGLVACKETNDIPKIDAGEIIETPKEANQNTETTNQEIINTETTNAETTNDELKHFESFLANDEAVYFDKVLENCNTVDFLSYSALNKSELAGKPFTFSELLQLVCENETKEYWTVMEPKTISYGYFDCGMDGKKDLVVYFNNMGENLDYTNVYIISLLEDKLQIVYSDSYGYRTYGSLNENGYYINSGSAGAANYIENYYYINEKGEVALDFTRETISSVWGLFLFDDNDYEAIAEEQGILNKIEITSYAFAFTNEGENYTDFLKNCSWTYYEINDNYERVENGAIYEEDSPYKLFWNRTGLPLQTPDEIDKIIEEHRKVAGIPKEAIDGEEVTTTSLSTSQLEVLFSWKTDDYQYEGVE